MSDEKKPNHELNLSKIQSGDFEIKGVNKVVNPVLLFGDKSCNFFWVYYLGIQEGSWLDAGGEWPKDLDYNYNPYSEELIVFTLEGFKKALKENKNKLILSWESYSVPLTPQEVCKIHQRIEDYQKDIAEKEAKAVIQQENTANLMKERKKLYNEKMDALREQRQKQFENQENAV